MNQKVCAIIVSAWQAEKWIEECVTSILKQRSTLAWRYELRLGIDGCLSTESAVARLGQAYYRSPVNVGTYIIRNSLIAAGRADVFAIFDADDVMHEGYITTLLKFVGNGIVGAGRNIIDERGKRTGRSNFRTGVCMISETAMKKLGAFHPDRIASDADLIWRAQQMGIPVVKAGSALYDRRKVPTSLTQRADTGMKSPMRREIVVRHTNLRKEGKLYVHPVVTPLYFVKGKR